MDSCRITVDAGEGATRLADGGRLVGPLIRLQRERFTGLLVASADGFDTAFVFMDGAVVFAEDQTVGEPFSRRLIEAGPICPEAFARAAAVATESLSPCQDLMITAACQALDLLDVATIRMLVQERVRMRVIQAVGLCDVELDEEPLDDLPDVARAWGAPPAPHVYLGLRTFFGESEVKPTEAHLGGHIARFPLAHGGADRGPDAVGVQLMLDADERRLLRQLAGEQTLAEVVASAELESLHAWQLITMLGLGGYCVFAAPGSRARSGYQSSASDQSVVRDRISLFPKAAAPGAVPAQGPRPSGVRAPAAPATHGVVEAWPAGRRGAGAGAAQGSAVSASARDVQHTLPEFGPGYRRPDTRPGLALDSAEAGGAGIASAPGMDAEAPWAAVLARQADHGPGDAPRVTPGAAVSAAASAARAQGSRPIPESPRAPASQRRPVIPAAAADEASPDNEASRRASPRRSPRREPNERRARSAVGRLGRELRRRRPSAGERQAATPARAAAPAAEPGADYGEAHLKALMRMRAASARRQEAEANAPKVQAADLLSRGRSLLDAEAFDRAADTFAELVALEPGARIYEGYRMYAAVRANPKSEQAPDLITELRALLRDYLNDDQHRGFAYYALGHAAFAEGNDATAEKLFRRATELDKKNKDAVRYVRILERRGKVEQPQKIFGIELSASVGSRKKR